MNLLKKVLLKIKELTTFAVQSDVDLYITSKNPKTAADVDYWMTRYNREGRTRSYEY
jgi:hypothetical protein